MTAGPLKAAPSTAALADGPLTAIGLMAGTSLDGIDAALIETDGNRVTRFGPTLGLPYDGETRATILAATRAALDGTPHAAVVADAGNRVSHAHVGAVQQLLDENGLAAADIDVIGFHGQTILHRPPTREAPVGHTIQIGGGGILAHALGIDTVADFRSADMAAGGEGAPLASAYHAALSREISGGEAGPLAVLNLGGVSNLTLIPEAGNEAEMVAFDCGPGNGLIDALVEARTGSTMDEGGALAAAGTVHDEALRLMALHPFLRRSAPKSLDRYDFKADAVADLSLEDAVATLTAFTAHCVAVSLKAVSEQAPRAVIVCGGGRHNPVMMAALKQRLPSPVEAAEAVGWRGDMIEAEAFAYLAVRRLRELPISFPGTTRAPRPMTGGEIFRRPL